MSNAVACFTFDVLVWPVVVEDLIWVSDSASSHSLGYLSFLRVALDY